MGAPHAKLALVSSGTPLETVSDDGLMQQAGAGSREAFECLIRRHQARVLQVAARFSSDTSMTQDIAQNAFLELHRNLARYEGRGKFTSYLCRIVINQCRLEARRRRRPRPIDASLLSRAEPPPGPDDTPDLEYAVSQLSEKLREVVVLRYSADLDLAQIAETLDLPLGTVKRRLFDAMAKLRHTLAEVV